MCFARNHGSSEWSQKGDRGGLVVAAGQEPPAPTAIAEIDIVFDRRVEKG
jgi:hypothetical protein